MNLADAIDPKIVEKLDTLITDKTFEPQPEDTDQGTAAPADPAKAEAPAPVVEPTPEPVAPPIPEPEPAPAPQIPPPGPMAKLEAEIAAAVAAPTKTARPPKQQRPKPPPPPERIPANCRLVGVRLHNGKAGSLTMLATESHTGDIVVGPYSCDWRHLMAEETFMESNDFARSKIRFSPFRLFAHSINLEMPGKLSVMNDHRYECPMCRSVDTRLNQREFNNRKGTTSAATCHNCAADRAAMRKPAIPLVEISTSTTTAISKGDPLLQLMYKAYRDPHPAPAALLPRIWAVYPSDLVPDMAWTPDPDRPIEARIRAAYNAAEYEPRKAEGVTLDIRPLQLAVAAQQNAITNSTTMPFIYGLVMEKIMGPVEQDHWVFGWMSERSLREPNIGYLVNVEPKLRNHQPTRHDVLVK